MDGLCSEVDTVVTQANSLRTVLAGLSLTGIIPVGLLLNLPSLTSALFSFTCP